MVTRVDASVATQRGIRDDNARMVSGVHDGVVDGIHEIRVVRVPIVDDQRGGVGSVDRLGGIGDRFVSVIVVVASTTRCDQQDRHAHQTPYDR